MKMDVESVMSRVRLEVFRRNHHAAPTPNQVTGGVAAWGGALPSLPYKKAYSVSDFLVYADRAFVENAYLGILRRHPDPGGLETHLGKLRSGAATKVEILAHLRWSAEGEALGVHVDGLLVPYTLQRWRRKPVIGPVIAWLHAFARLGSMPERLSMNEAVQARDAFCLAEHMDGVWRNLGERTSALETAAQNHERRMVDLADAFEHQAEAARSSMSKLAERVRQIDAANRAGMVRIQGTVQAIEDRLSGTQASVQAIEDRLAGTQASVQAIEDRLAGTQANVQAVEDRLAGTQASVQAVEDRLAGTQAGLQAMDDGMARMQASHEATKHRTTEEIGQLSSQLQSIRVQDDALREMVDGLQASLMAKDAMLAEHRHHLAAQGHALALIEQARAAKERLERSLDSLYVAFEETFRGSNELIRERAMPYLELVREAHIGTAERPILDIGCGRGDWLDILGENGLVARGVDSNEAFVALCRSRGLDVVAGDAIEYLRTLPDGSLGGITGMHIVEHLPFETLIELLDECRRVLGTGGLLALETPNPENLTVATLNFYLDPTHRNPLPPVMLRWIVEARGFQDVNIHRWTVARDTGAPPLLDDGVAGASSVNVLLSTLAAAPDYAIVARRPA